MWEPGLLNHLDENDVLSSLTEVTIFNDVEASEGEDVAAAFKSDSMSSGSDVKNADRIEKALGSDWTNETTNIPFDDDTDDEIMENNKGKENDIAAEEAFSSAVFDGNEDLQMTKKEVVLILISSCLLLLLIFALALFLVKKVNECYRGSLTPFQSLLVSQLKMDINRVFTTHMRKSSYATENGRMCTKKSSHL